jgi:hypothetical protein
MTYSKVVVSTISLIEACVNDDDKPMLSLIDGLRPRKCCYWTKCPNVLNE